MDSTDGTVQKSKVQLKAERKAEFEAKNKDLIKGKESQKEKSKAELRAERRQKQELQRSEKVTGHKHRTLHKETVQSKLSIDDKSLQKEKSIINESVNRPKEFEKSSANESQSTDVIHDKANDLKSINNKKMVPMAVKKQIFAHLPHKHDDVELLISQLKCDSMHPIVIQIGLRFNKGIIKGSNARCVAMLIALKTIINNYKTPPSKVLTRDLEANIDTCVKFLSKCRPLSLSMVNAVKFLKLTFSKISADKNDSESKRIICESIDNYIYSEIILAQKGISNFAITKIASGKASGKVEARGRRGRDYEKEETGDSEVLKIDDSGDVIMIYGCSLIVKHVLYNAKKYGKKFSVVIVDSRPHFNGKEMLKYLLNNDIPVTYIYINSVPYMMKEVTKVLFGAHALLANGYVMSQIGTSQIALVAHAYNVPVLVCCETYKFSERVHTDSFVFNEFGDSRNLLNPISTKSETQQNINELYRLDLVYDVTPPELVSVVITEIGVLPCSSAPAVLRFRETK